MSEATPQNATPKVLSVRTSGLLYTKLEEIAQRDEISISAAARQLLARALRAEHRSEPVPEGSAHGRPSRSTVLPSAV